MLAAGQPLLCSRGQIPTLPNSKAQREVDQHFCNTSISDEPRIKISKQLSFAGWRAKSRSNVFFEFEVFVVQQIFLHILTSGSCANHLATNLGWSGHFSSGSRKNIRHLNQMAALSNLIGDKPREVRSAGLSALVTYFHCSMELKKCARAQYDQQRTFQIG